MPYFGEICALLTALCWTGSSTAFAIASRAAGPLPANQFRLLAAVPVLVTLAWLLTGSGWPAASNERVGLLAASGLAGLVLGDIGLFYALATIGPRISMVVMACWPACGIAIDALRGDAPSARVLFGVALTMFGVGIVLLRNRDGGAWRSGVQRWQVGLGLLGALLGALGQASGVVLSRLGMAVGDDAPHGVDPLQATVVRMVTAVVGLQVVATCMRQPFAFRKALADRTAARAALLGALFGPIGGVWLSMVAVHHAERPAVAYSLMATTPIFMMPVAALLYGARIGGLGALGTVLAVGGVATCFLAR